MDEVGQQSLTWDDSAEAVPFSEFHVTTVQSKKARYGLKIKRSSLAGGEIVKVTSRSAERVCDSFDPSAVTRANS